MLINGFQHDMDVVIEVPEKGKAVQNGRFNQGVQLIAFYIKLFLPLFLTKNYFLTTFVLPDNKFFSARIFFNGYILLEKTLKRLDIMSGGTT